MPDPLQLEIATPERLLVRERASSVQLPGKDGYLGVLPGHAALLSELATGTLAYVSGGQEHFLALNGGFAEVLNDHVRVLADTAERAQEIDVDRARAARERAQQRLVNPILGIDIARALSAMTRAEARLRAAQQAGAGLPTEAGR
ncbi:MAG: F0F1 ATP synthase subunit epsilon [Acidobacteria bacterium]|nr:F0F1 ATP synthase subunit epsilon [Acidobacteriota bacterium]